MSATDKKTYLVYDPRNASRKPRPYTVLVDPEFESLIAPLRPEEHALLEADIREHGLRDRLVVWWDGTSPVDEVVLLDGHTRLAILAKIQAESLADGTRRPTIYAQIHPHDLADFPDRAAAMLWIEENQIGRRNLTDDQRAVIWDSIRERRSAIAKSERAVNARAAQDPDEPRLSDKTTDKQPSAPAKRDTRKEVATESGLPERKLRAVAALKKLHPEKVQDVWTGKTSLREATKQTKSKPQPAPEPTTLTLKELLDWYGAGEDDAFADFDFHKRKGELAGKVDLTFHALDPTTAKKLAEYYLRLKKAEVS
jgi:hypothetical protein